MVVEERYRGLPQPFGFRSPTRAGRGGLAEVVRVARTLSVFDLARFLPGSVDPLLLPPAVRALDGSVLSSKLKGVLGGFLDSGGGNAHTVCAARCAVWFLGHNRTP